MESAEKKVCLLSLIFMFLVITLEALCHNQVKELGFKKTRDVHKQPV